jgi:hypothetical protein
MDIAPDGLAGDAQYNRSAQYGNLFRNQGYGLFVFA